MEVIKYLIITKIQASFEKLYGKENHRLKTYNSSYNKKHKFLIKILKQIRK